MSGITSRLMLAALLGVFALGALTNSTGAQGGTTATTTPPPASSAPAPKRTYWQQNGCKTYVKQKQYRKALRRSFRYSIVSGDFRASSVKKRVHKRLFEMRECAHSKKARKNMLRAHRKQRRMHAWVARIDAITPYGKWAIPPYIVRCESGGAWGAYNPSGASGPYQLLGWGAPMPANTIARQARHHIIAARLWSGGRGASHWVCA